MLPVAFVEICPKRLGLYKEAAVHSLIKSLSRNDKRLYIRSRLQLLAPDFDFPTKKVLHYHCCTSLYGVLIIIYTS